MDILKQVGAILALLKVAGAQGLPFGDLLPFIDRLIALLEVVLDEGHRAAELSRLQADLSAFLGLESGGGGR